MSEQARRRVVLVTRKTRLRDLIERHNTLAQARFYVEHLQADFADYVLEDERYARAHAQAMQALAAWGRYQVVERALLPNFVFSASDIVVALGQDGLVANTLKYLDKGQPLVGLNPDTARWDGVLLPFEAPQLADVLRRTDQGSAAVRSVTMAEARLSDGQRLLAVNDFFVGPRSHTSALYELELGGRSELQSSSGVIVSTGMGSTAWIKSVVTGSVAVADALGHRQPCAFEPLPWGAPELLYAVREPFPSRHSHATLVFGRVSGHAPLTVRSRMAYGGVIFSDGMEADFLRFGAGVEAVIAPSAISGQLVVG